MFDLSQSPSIWDTASLTALDMFVVTNLYVDLPEEMVTFERRPCGHENINFETEWHATRDVSDQKDLYILLIPQHSQMLVPWIFFVMYSCYDNRTTGITYLDRELRCFQVFSPSTFPATHFILFSALFKILEYKTLTPIGVSTQFPEQHCCWDPKGPSCPRSAGLGGGKEATNLCPRETAFFLWSYNIESFWRTKFKVFSVQNWGGAKYAMAETQKQTIPADFIQSRDFGERGGSTGLGQGGSGVKAEVEIERPVKTAGRLEVMPQVVAGWLKGA